LIYIDTSALLKLVRTDEAEGPAVRDYLAGSGDSRLVSSALLSVEARRGVLRGRPDGLPKVDLLLADVAQIEVSDAVIGSASRLPDPMLGSPDAIHLATALLIRDELDVLLSYDERLVAAAKAHDVPTASPARS
jgi:predicted nucleic acid-binding protein